MFTFSELLCNFFFFWGETFPVVYLLLLFILKAGASKLFILSQQYASEFIFLVQKVQSPMKFRQRCFNLSSRITYYFSLVYLYFKDISISYWLWLFFLFSNWLVFMRKHVTAMNRNQNLIKTAYDSIHDI